MGIPWSCFMEPRSIAVIGVSRREDDYVNHYVRTLIEYGYTGRIYLVNPREDTILGFKVYRSVLDIEGPIDLAYVAVPSEAMEEVLDECGVKGVRAAIVFSSDSDILSPTGSRGIAEVVRRAVERWGMRIIGPNCLGIYRPRSGISFAHGFPRDPGDVAFISQSGGHAAAMGWLGASIGLRFSAIVSYGNAVDIDLPDLIAYFREDPETRVIVAYVEGVKDGKRLLSELKEAVDAKPVILWKGGLTEEGSKAVATHTLALAGSWRVWRAAFRQVKAVTVSSLEEAAYTALTFSLAMDELSGHRLAVVSISGGEAVTATDTCIGEGLALARLTEATLERLKRVVPRYGSSINNPVDIQLAALDAATFREILEVLAEDPQVDALLVLQSMEWPILYRGARRFHELIDVLCEVRRVKPIFVVMQCRLFHGDYVSALERLVQARIPVYPSIRMAASSIAKLSAYKSLRGFKVASHIGRE